MRHARNFGVFTLTSGESCSISVESRTHGVLRSASLSATTAAPVHLRVKAGGLASESDFVVCTLTNARPAATLALAFTDRLVLRCDGPGTVTVLITGSLDRGTFSKAATASAQSAALERLWAGTPPASGSDPLPPAAGDTMGDAMGGDVMGDMGDADSEVDTDDDLNELARALDLDRHGRLAGVRGMRYACASWAGFLDAPTAAQVSVDRVLLNMHMHMHMHMPLPTCA